MKVLSAVLGVLMAILGFSLTFTPLRTFMSSGYYLAIMLVVYGTIGIIRAVTSKKYNLGFVLSILSFIGGILLFALPQFIVLTDAILVYSMSVWFIFEGVVGIVNSLKLKKNNSKKWGWVLALGIIGLIVGIYSVFHPLVSAITMGVLIGIYFVKSGLTMALNAFADDDK